MLSVILRRLGVAFSFYCRCEMQYIDEALAMRRKKQELARRPDRILPSSLLHPMPSPTYVPSTSLTLVTYRSFVATSQRLMLMIQAHWQPIMILLPPTRRSAYFRRQHAPTAIDRHSDVRRPTFK